MKQIDEKLLKYCGIYKSPELSERQKKEVLNKKRELEKRTGMKIEKVYAYGKKYWGKDATQETFTKQLCFLVDERLKSIDEIWPAVDQYGIELYDTSILFWSLCQFEKRKQSMAELDYYISNYGALIYDSKKEPDIDENIQSTEYAGVVREVKATKKYLNLSHIAMQNLIVIYLLKIGYYSEIGEKDVRELTEYVNYVSEDKKIKQILEEYVNEKEEEKRKQICRNFEEYIKNVKQVRTTFKLQNEPTMQVYERKKEQFDKNGVLDIKDLNKEDLYIMYIIQHKNTYEIAQLYGVENQKINSKRNNYHIKVREEIITPQHMTELENKIIEDKIVEDKASSYLAQKRMGILSFEKCLYPILNFMKMGETYLLKEFWKFTEFEKTNIEKNFAGENTTNWYRATLAFQFLQENQLVEEVGFKKYKITRKGRKVVKAAQLNERIDLVFLIKILKEVKLFGEEYRTKDLAKITIEMQAFSGLFEVEDVEQMKKDIPLKEDLFTAILSEEKIEQTNEKQEEIKTEEIISNLKVTEDVNGDCQFKSYQSTRKRKETIKSGTCKSRGAKNKEEITDEMKSSLGIKGEQYIYQCLNKNAKELLERIKITGYRSILFYNINYEKLQEDKSVGHGCDIELILENGKHLYIEVKTSLDNTEYYTMTYNEYKCAMEKQDDYFVIKVNNFKYLNKDEKKISVTIIQNPYKIFMENIELLKNIALYTNY